MAFYVYPFASVAAYEAETEFYGDESELDDLLPFEDETVSYEPDYNIEYNSQDTVSSAEVVGEVEDLRDEI